MKELQVLVATMHQKDTALVVQMNIRCSAVVANQADEDSYLREVNENGTVQMITTATRGVGLNRNIALLRAEAEYVLFSDDDVVYNDDMPCQVLKAFSEIPEADILIFGMDILKTGKAVEKRHLMTKRRYVWKSLRFGTYTIAAKRKSLLQNNILFNQLFGGGCMYSAGEDSLFLKSCFDHGLKVYSHQYVLGTCCKDTSSWFVGYNDKYFYDKGVLVRFLFPKIAYAMALYFAIRFKRDTAVSVWRRLKLVYAGVRHGKKLMPYAEYVRENKEEM